MAFMRPEIVPGSYLLSLGLSPEDLGITPEADKWYGRLSSSRYLDSTEWSEYSTEAEAMRGVCETFGLCETCHEEGWDCDCETDDDDDSEPRRRACNDPDCRGCW